MLINILCRTAVFNYERSGWKPTCALRNALWMDSCRTKKKNQGWKLFHSSAAANKKVLMTSWWSFRGHELFIHTHFYNFKCGPLSSKSIILKERVDHAAIMNISRVWFCRTIFDSPEHEFLPVLYAQFMSILTFIELKLFQLLPMSQLNTTIVRKNQCAVLPLYVAGKMQVPCAIYFLNNNNLEPSSQRFPHNTHHNQIIRSFTISLLFMLFLTPSHRPIDHFVHLLRPADDATQKKI